MNQAVGHAVEVAVGDHVIVDVDAGRGPVAVLIALGGQGAQSRLVERFKQAAACAFGFAERSVVEAR